MIEAGILILSCAMLNRFAGAGGHRHSKLFRRIGIPLLITLYGLWRHQWSSFICLPYGYAIFCLPITLVGDDITEHWYNWIWLYVLGILIGLIPFWIGFSGVWHSLAYGLLFGLLVSLSNVKRTAEVFKWKYVELAYGGLLGLITFLTP